MVYLLIFLFLFFLAFVFDYLKLGYIKGLSKILVFIVLVSLSGFRYRVGGDTHFYILMYDYIPYLSDLFTTQIMFFKLQPLWILLSSISKTIYPDFFVFQLIHAIIVNGIILHFFNKNTKYFFTAVLLYYIGFYGYFNFEILRESIAVSFFLLSFDSLKNKNWVKYYLISLISFSFHYSAAILFLIPLIQKLRINTSIILIVIIFGLILNSLFSDYIIKISSISSFVLSLKTYGDYTYTTWGFIYILLVFIIYPSIILFLVNYFNIEKGELVSLFKTYIFLGALSTLFFIFYRFLNYLTPLLFLFLTEILHVFNREKKLKEIAPVLFFISFIVISFIHTARYFSDTSEKVSSSRWYSRWYPYYSIFDKKIDTTREQLYRNL